MATVAPSPRSSARPPEPTPSAFAGAPTSARASKRRLRRRTGGVILAAALLLAVSAHIGSPDTWFSGDAGPYRLLVHVRSPTSIPGTAPIEVSVEGAQPDEILARVEAREGEAAPPTVQALPSSGDPGTFRAQLPVTVAGPGSVIVQARGPRGEGSVVVSVTFLPIQRIQLTGRMALGLGLVAAVLLGGLVGAVGAAVRNPPGAEPGSGSRRSARLAMGATTALIAVGLFQGKRWWDAQDRAYLASLSRPLAAVAEVVPAAAGPEITVRVTDQAWAPGGRGREGDGPLIPDHGKLMHMFVIGDDRESFAHLHPVTTDSTSFHVTLPPLPAGGYRVFAEVTRESGLAQTITASLEIPAVAGYGPPSDEDDSWKRGALARGAEARLADGSVLHWERGSDPVVAGTPAPLRFTLTDSAGAPLPVEPYMGMTVHAAVLRDDDSVFVHLHPAGTVSAAAQRAVSLRTAGDTLSGGIAPSMAAADLPHMLHSGHGAMPETLSIPYAFPAPGRYNLWVQLKHGGRVLTGAFLVEVDQALSAPG